MWIGQIKPVNQLSGEKEREWVRKVLFYKRKMGTLFIEMCVCVCSCVCGAQFVRSRPKMQTGPKLAYRVHGYVKGDVLLARLASLNVALEKVEITCI